MTGRMHIALGAANAIPKMYVNAIIVGIIAYFGFKFMFYISDEWRKFKQECK